MKATLRYLSNLSRYESEKPYELWLPAEQLAVAGVSFTNCEFEERSDITIQDVRSSNALFAFDTTGFKFVSDPLTFDCPDLLFKQDTSLKEYLEHTIALVKQEFEAEKVICFDWRYRVSQGSKRDDDREYEPDREQPLRPAHVAHQDDSVGGGQERLRRHLTKHEIKAYENGLRARFVNVWRPLVAAVEDMPLALCDRRTVAGADLIDCDKVHPDHVGEGTYLKYGPSHQWYWLSHQTKDEPAIFVTWDSRAESHPAGPPHVAFQDPSAKRDALPRKSIEVRCIVLT
ncbi:hypothetical protein BDR22DRAFT_845712 [Usnea florida]